MPAPEPSNQCSQHQYPFASSSNSQAHALKADQLPRGDFGRLQKGALERLRNNTRHALSPARWRRVVVYLVSEAGADFSVCSEASEASTGACQSEHRAHWRQKLIFTSQTRLALKASNRRVAHTVMRLHVWPCPADCQIISSIT